MLIFYWVWISCILTMTNGSPLSENRTQVVEISSNFYDQTNKSIPEGSRLREKRHIQYLMNVMNPKSGWNYFQIPAQTYFQSIFGTLGNALGQMQPATNANGTTLANTVNQFIQNASAMVLQNLINQLRSSLNQIFSSAG